MAWLETGGKGIWIWLGGGRKESGRRGSGGEEEKPSVEMVMRIGFWVRFLFGDVRI